MDNGPDGSGGGGGGEQFKKTKIRQTHAMSTSTGALLPPQRHLWCSNKERQYACGPKEMKKERKKSGCIQHPVGHKGRHFCHFVCCLCSPAAGALRVNGRSAIDCNNNSRRRNRSVCLFRPAPAPFYSAAGGRKKKEEVPGDAANEQPTNWKKIPPERRTRACGCGTS